MPTTGNDILTHTVYNQNYYDRHIDVLKQNQINWRLRKQRARWVRPKTKRYRIISDYRKMIQRAIRGKYGSRKRPGKILDVLGVSSIQEFKDYISSQFQPGMTWDNYGQRGWHVHHIKPISLFDVLDPVEAAAAFHHANCAPLWCEDNNRHPRRARAYASKSITAA